MARPGGASGPAEEPPAAPRWGMGDAALGYVVGLIVSSLAVTAWVAATHSRATSLGEQVVGLVGLWIGFGGAPYLATMAKGARSLRRDFGLAFRWWDPLVGILAGGLSQVVLVPLLYLPVRALDPHVEQKLGQPAQNLTGLAHGPAAVVVLAAFVAVGAPVVEELFFRGLLLRAIGRRFGAAWGVVGSAVLFGLAHFEPLQLLALVAFGAVLGVLAVRTGRLGPGMFAHATFNAITVAVLVTAR